MGRTKTPSGRGSESRRSATGSKLQLEAVAESDVGLLDEPLDHELGLAEGEADVDLDAGAELDDLDEAESGIDLAQTDVQCSGRDASIRRAIEERREARQLRDALDYLDIDD